MLFRFRSKTGGAVPDLPQAQQTMQDQLQQHQQRWLALLEKDPAAFATLEPEIHRCFAQFADQYPELEHVVARGASILVVAEETGRYVPTNEPYDVWWLHAFVVRDGKIARVREAASNAGPWERPAGG